jgi:Cft2 family RNA processing exonuclease
MKLTCLGSSSAGNCYLLQADSGETLILDCGIPIKEIKKGLNWDIRGIKGVIISHAHL